MGQGATLQIGMHSVLSPLRLLFVDRKLSHMQLLRRRRSDEVARRPQDQNLPVTQNGSRKMKRTSEDRQVT